MLYQILINYGIPAMFYTDRRTVFEYKRKDRFSDAEDTFTQFSYACHNLGIKIKTMSVPQAKGRVERLNQMLQSRLPVELRHAHITNI
ncbi:MAG: ISNCY family transposase, partial [Catenibacterium mitsuokai]|nr:ISNCY family transposase [Catenibacterium mitsuokai]